MYQTARFDPPLPLLVTGVTGVAGYNAFGEFRRRYGNDVWAIRQQSNWRIDWPGVIACDAEDSDGLNRLFDKHKFGAVLDCAGNCALRSCELDPAMAWRLNVEGPTRLAEVAAARGIPLLHLSIDLVYSGTSAGQHTEADATDPVTVYGKTMVEAEAAIGAIDPSACILRISLPMGPSLSGHAGAIDWIQSRFRQNKPATLYYDEIRTPAYTDCLNELFAAVLHRGLSGLYHAGGPRPLSLYQIAQIVNRVGGYDPDHLMGCPRHQAGPIPPRAGDVTLDSSRLTAALGFEPLGAWPADERWVPTDNQWHRHRPTDQPCSPELLEQVLYVHPRRYSSGSGGVNTSPTV